jgi:hypothetical protein
MRPDLDAGVLHHVIDRCVELHWLPKFPLSKWKTLNREPKRRVRLITSGELHRLCKAARLDAESLSMIPLKYRHLRAAQAVTGEAFSDYLYLVVAEKHFGGALALGLVRLSGCECWRGD